MVHPRRVSAGKQTYWVAAVLVDTLEQTVTVCVMIAVM